MGCTLLVRKRDHSSMIHDYLVSKNCLYLIVICQDESGSAAILAVELDEQFDGAAIQHRECQGAESPMFLSYFKNGVRYLAGGVKSGFTHYDPEDVPRRLFKVKGKRNVQVMEVMSSFTKKEMAYSLSGSTCFVFFEQI